MIPMYIFEEHHMAYCVWHRAAFRGEIPGKGNLLLHVDHHDDLETGWYTRDFTAPPADEAEARDVAENCLGVADFIVPTFWEGLFDEMVDFKSIFSKKEEPRSVTLFLKNGHELFLRDTIPMVDAPDAEDRKYISIRELSLQPLALPDKPVVLDIDLDYFCWDNTLSEKVPALIEITREAYEEFNADPGHPWRLLARRIIFAREIDGKYYLELNEPRGPAKPTRELRIRQRAEKFFAWLRENEIRPAMIDICRSRRSGYCPARWEPLAEELVLAGLRELYGEELGPLQEV